MELSAPGRLVITDRGRGLTVEEIGRIDAFQQFDRQKYEQQGLGLGLVLVQKLMVFCQGEFSISSVPGEGTQVQIAFLNQDRRYIYANNAYAEVLDLPSSAIVGRRLSDVLPKIYEEQIRPRSHRAFAGERVSYDLHKETENGNHHYTVTYDPRKVNGTVTLVAAVITDITESRRAEELLRLSLERFEIVARATNEAIWDWDLNTSAVQWNEGYRALFGYSPAETEPTIDSWTKFIHPEDVNRVLKSVHQMVEGDDHIWSDEYRFRCRDGT